MCNPLSSLRFKATGSDSWHWLWGSSGCFSVKEMTYIIQNKILANTIANPDFKWIKLLPIKINVFLWRLFNNGLPTRMNLAVRNIQVPSSSCVFCSSDPEVEDHCFFRCSKLASLWKKVASWWDIMGIPFDSVGSFGRNSLFSPSTNQLNRVFAAISSVVVWAIWGWRNRLVFAKQEELHKFQNEDLFSLV